MPSKSLRIEKPSPACEARQQRNYDDGEEIEQQRGQASLEICALGNLHAGEAQACGKRAWLHAFEPDYRASGYAGDSRHGSESAAFGGNCKLAISSQLS